MALEIFTSEVSYDLSHSLKLNGIKCKRRWKKPISFLDRDNEFELNAFMRGRELIFIHKTYLLGCWVYFLTTGMPKMESVEMVNEYLSIRQELKSTKIN